MLKGTKRAKLRKNDQVVVIAGRDKGKSGRIKVSELQDVGGGRATIQLPISSPAKAGAAAPTKKP